MILRREGGITYSDDGWSLQIIGRSQLKYVEGDREAIVSCEFPFQSGVALYPQQMHHWLVPAGQPLTEEEKSRIIARISDAIEWAGLKIHIRENGIVIVSIGGHPSLRDGNSEIDSEAP